MSAHKSPDDNGPRAIVDSSSFRSDGLAGALFVAGGIVIVLRDIIAPSMLVSVAPTPEVVPALAVIVSLIVGTGILLSDGEASNRWRRAGLVTAICGTLAALVSIMSGSLSAVPFVMMPWAITAALWQRESVAVSTVATLGFSGLAVLNSGLLWVANPEAVLAGDVLGPEGRFVVEVPERQWRLVESPSEYEIVSSDLELSDRVRRAEFVISFPRHSAGTELAAAELVTAERMGDLNDSRVHSIEMLDASEYPMAVSRVAGRDRRGWVDLQVFVLTADGQRAHISCVAPQRWRSSVMDECRAMAMSFRWLE